MPDPFNTDPNIDPTTGLQKPPQFPAAPQQGQGMQVPIPMPWAQSGPGGVNIGLPDLSQGIPQAPPTEAETAYRRVLNGMPQLPHPGIWQKIAAMGAGFGAGVLNSDRLYQGSKVDPTAAIKGLSGITGYNRELQAWEQQAGAAKAAVSDERQHNEDLLNARVKESEIQANLEARKANLSSTQWNRESMRDINERRIQEQQNAVDERVGQQASNQGLVTVPNVSQTPSSLGLPPIPQGGAGSRPAQGLDTSVRPEDQPVAGLPFGAPPQVPVDLPSYVPQGSVPVPVPAFVTRQNKGQDVTTFQKTGIEKGIESGKLTEATEDQAKVLKKNGGDVIPTSQANTVQVGLRTKAPNAGAAKAAAAAVMQKVAAANPGVDMSDNTKMAAAIKRAKLSPEDEAQLEAYIALNPTPASTMSAGVARMVAARDLTPVQLFDSQTGNIGTGTVGDLVKNEYNPDGSFRFAPAGEGAKIYQRTGIYTELDGAISRAKESLKGVVPTPALTAALAAMATPDKTPSAIHNFAIAQLKNAAFTNPDGSTNGAGRYFQNIATLRESAMTLRALGMMGQGNEKQQQAILDTIPSSQWVSPQFHADQLNRLQVQVNQLHSGLPGLGGPGSVSPRFQIPPSQGGKLTTYTQADVDAAVKAGHGTAASVKAAMEAAGRKLVQ